MNPENINKEYKSIYVKPAKWQHVYNSIAIAFYWLSFELKHKRQSLSQQFFCRLWIFECNTSFVCVCVCPEPKWNTMLKSRTHLLLPNNANMLTVNCDDWWILWNVNSICSQVTLMRPPNRKIPVQMKKLCSVHHWW